MALHLFSGAWYAQILLELVIILFITITDSIVSYGTSALLKISLSELIWRKNAYIVIGTLNKLIVLLCTWLTYHFRNVYGLRSIHRKWFALMLMFPLISMIILMLNYYNNQRNQDISMGVLLISAFLAVANMGVIYLMHSLEKATIKEQEAALLKQQIEYQKENFIALEQSYRNQRKVTHEFERHIETLRDLLVRDESITACEYVNRLQKDRNLRVFCINTRHPVIDVILNQKHQLAYEFGIKMQVQINDLASVQIQPDAIVVLLANLLDNAIEACQKVNTRKEICCTILHGESLYISIRNTTQPVVIQNGEIATDPKRSIEHGYGIPAIKLILEQLNAEYTFEYEDGWFQFVADIPI